jgi:hypothetical protein
MIHPSGGLSTPDRMPTRLLAQIKRTPEAQAIWEQLPEGMRARVLVWIDCLYFPSEESTTSRKVVWFVDQWTDRDWRVDWPVSDTVIPYLCLAC